MQVNWGESTKAEAIARIARFWVDEFDRRAMRAHTTPEPDNIPPDENDPLPQEVPQRDPTPVQDPIPHQEPIKAFHETEAVCSI